MILKRFYDGKLAQASYLIGCAATGEALVVDPNRDVNEYIQAAEAEGVRVTHVTETHIHADFVSGSRELASRTGAQLLLSDEGDADWKYEYAREAGAGLLTDGSRFWVGNVLLEALHTPGHTPEHLSFLVTDTAAADQPIGVLTGDFVFVGDVGRPDLLETAAGVTGAMEAGARTLFHSLQRFKARPDYLQVWPGHGAGSACGKDLSSVPYSTVGYERRFNWAFTVEDEDEFVRMVLTGQPEPPRYFARMKQLNREGPRILGGFPHPDRLAAEQLPRILDNGALVVDTRPAAEYAVGHVPGTLNLPLDNSFPTWAGWLIPSERDLYLIADKPQSEEAVRDLAMVGLDRIAGWFGIDALDAWTRSGRAPGTVPQVSPRQLTERSGGGDAIVLDVRDPAEWQAGHLPGVQNIPVGHLSERLDEIPRGEAIVVHCQSGARSAIAASLLQAQGFGDVANLTGGFAAWEAAGYPTESEAGANHEAV